MDSTVQTYQRVVQDLLRSDEPRLLARQSRFRGPAPIFPGS